jgi:hypothetical protein
MEWSDMKTYYKCVKKYNPIEVKVRETGDGIYSCSYVPKRGAKHTVQVSII